MLPLNHNSTGHLKRAVVLACCVLLILMALGCEAVNTVSLPTTTPAATVMPTPTETATLIPTLSPTTSGPPVLCGGPPAMFILLVGSDARSNSYAVGLADSIRVVRVDFVEPRIQVLTFQRDLYVEIPEIESHNGITSGKLNQAYLYGNPGYAYYDGAGQGPGLLALTLEHNFGAQIDHYAAVNLQTFVDIVDELGGIDIELPDEIDGRVKGSKDSDLYFPAGKQHLNGYRTMLLARLRPRGDFRRADVQNLILQALAESLLDPSAIRKLPRLIATFRDSVQTDLGPVEIGHLLCLRARLSEHNIEFVSFPEGLFKNGRVRDPVLGNTSILEVDFDVLKRYVRNFNQGNWPELEESSREKIVP